MRQTDFETTSASRSWEVSAVLRCDSKTRSKMLSVSSVMGFRVGMRVSVNPCGATEEQHVVEGFQPSAVVIEGVLRHDHYHGERVCGGGRISQHEAASCEVQRSEDAALDPCSVRLDFDDGSVYSSGSEVVEDVEYDSAVDFSYFAASVGFAQEKRRFSVELAAVVSKCPSAEAGSSVVWDCGEMPAPVPRALQSSQAGSVRSNLRVVRGVVLSLVWFLRPAWVAHDVATRRTERYGVFLTAAYVAAFFQCLLFMLGDGCEHQPQPANCQRAGSLLDWSNVSRSAWSLAFALPFTVGVFRLFQRRPVHGVRTHTERKQKLVQWRRRGRCGWALLAVTHLVLLLFFVSFVNFYPVNLVWTWVHGCTLSTLVTTMSSPVTRAVNLVLAKQFLAFARGECL